MKHDHKCLVSKVMENPIEPMVPNAQLDLRDVILSMSKMSFQGRMLGDALRVWEAMLDSKSYVYMGLAGAMIPAGMRKIVDWLIRTDKINCLVSTGANLFHELHETLGFRHFKGHPDMDDLELKSVRLDRIYDTLAVDEEFCSTAAFIRDFAMHISKKNKSISTSRYLREFGAYLKEKGKKSFIVTAYEKGVPIYCPALTDSSYGIGMVAFGKRVPLTFDLLEDLDEITKPVINEKHTGVVYLGGGTPKNFIQQAELIGQEKFRNENGLTYEEAVERIPGHEYALQISTDAPHWGGLSGCTLEEGQSWGKESVGAKMVNLYCDVTIALPLLADALAIRDAKKKASKSGPKKNAKKSRSK